MLIVDDERDIAAMLADYFALEGYRILVAGTAADAIRLAAKAPDVMLLDVTLPDGDGFEVCRAVRERVSCPILFLTARVEDADAIAAFAAGGDDYVTKPFSLDVLGARVRAQLARERRSSHLARVRYGGDIVIDYACRAIDVPGGRIELARKDFDIVALLAGRRGQVFDRDMIYERVWGEPGDSTVVMEHVRRIRRAFSRAGCGIDPIKTVWGVGYTWRA